MRWPWRGDRGESAAVEKARERKQRVERLYEDAQKPLAEADEKSNRVIYQLDQNHFGLLMRASMERR